MLEQNLSEVIASPAFQHDDDSKRYDFERNILVYNLHINKNVPLQEANCYWYRGQTKMSCDIDAEESLSCSSTKKRKNKNKKKKRRKRQSEESILSNKEEEEEEEEGDEDVDGGYAWVILIVIFLINASTFGTARAYGLIFESSARHDEQSRSSAALPFTTMGAVENMAGPLTGYLLARTGSWRVMVFVGSCLITVSHLLAAAWADSALGQILTLGLMCGLGQSFVSISCFQINNAYFARYRSRAFGIGLTGAAMGTFYISPLCQFVLDNHTRSLCYLMLGLILLPNVPLALLLKPKPLSADCNAADEPGSTDSRPEVADKSQQQQQLTATAVVAAAATSVTIPQPSSQTKPTVFSISHQLIRQEDRKSKIQDEGFWFKVGRVLKTPLFHLIWPTQLLFCWLNFVFGMIITDFGKDRGLSEAQNSNLIIIWAAGQLSGRLCLGALVDLRILSYKSFTMVCFASISLITWMLNNFGTLLADDSDQDRDLTSGLICLFVFILAMFISTLYILFNGLVVNYMDSELTALSVGISSFTGSFFLLPRANIIGYYRDTCGNYDSMLTMFTCITMVSAIVWLIVPEICSYFARRRRHRTSAGAAAIEELLSNCSLSSTSSASEQCTISSSTTHHINKPDVVHWPSIKTTTIPPANFTSGNEPPLR